MESKNMRGLRYIRRSKTNFMLMARTQGLYPNSLTYLVSAMRDILVENLRCTSYE